MATPVTININLPRADMAFIKQLGKRMGWIVSEVKPIDSLYDPESGEYLNAETMQAIREVEAGKCMRCKDMNELLASLILIQTGCSSTKRKRQ